MIAGGNPKGAHQRLVFVSKPAKDLTKPVLNAESPREATSLGDSVISNLLEPAPTGVGHYSK